MLDSLPSRRRVQACVFAPICWRGPLSANPPCRNVHVQDRACPARLRIPFRCMVLLRFCRACAPKRGLCPDPVPPQYSGLSKTFTGDKTGFLAEKEKYTDPDRCTWWSCGFCAHTVRV